MFSRFSSLRRRPVAFRTARRTLALESLPARRLLHADNGGIFAPTDTAAVDIASPMAGVQADVAFAGNLAGSLMGDTIDWSNLPIYLPTQREIDQQMGLPLLDSNPGAPVTIYLDFNGNFESDWFFLNENGTETHFHNVSTPIFNTDGNSASFSSTEQNIIRQIWQLVAEDYAPFHVNVSTAYYGGFADRQAVHVVLGGSNSDWLKFDSSGIASIGSFTNRAPNTVFVFDLVAWANAGIGDSEGHTINGPFAMGTTASHEAGHAFGLRHHSLYNVSGGLINAYHPGTQGWTPIMGNNKAADRTTWDYSPSDLGPNAMQDDLAILASANNGFGFRADDRGDSRAAAYPLTSSSSTLVSKFTGSGIIHRSLDQDFFKFTSPGGSFTVDVRAASVGPNLMPIAELWNANGFVSSATGGSTTQSLINVTLPAGEYFVAVRSFGDYGGVGQYTVSVSFPKVLTRATTTLAVVPSALLTTDSTPQTTATTTALGAPADFTGPAISIAHPPAATMPPQFAARNDGPFSSQALAPVRRFLPSDAYKSRLPHTWATDFLFSQHHRAL